MVITDRYDHVVDDKNRLAIPSQVRTAMDPDVDGSAFFLVPKGRYLELIPEKLFQRLASMANAGLEVAPEIAKARRLMFAGTARLDPDKAGRVNIPDRFMKDTRKPDPFAEAVLERSVTLVGVGDRLELWNRADFMGHMRELYLDRASVQPAAQRLFSGIPTGVPPANG